MSNCRRKERRAAASCMVFLLFPLLAVFRAATAVEHMGVCFFEGSLFCVSMTGRKQEAGSFPICRQILVEAAHLPMGAYLTRSFQRSCVPKRCGALRQLLRGSKAQQQATVAACRNFLAEARKRCPVTRQRSPFAATPWAFPRKWQRLGVCICSQDGGHVWEVSCVRSIPHACYF